MWNNEIDFDEDESKQLKRVDLEIVGRILYSLIRDGPSRKTLVARSIHLNYDYFIRYLKFLEMLDFVKRECSNKIEIINLRDRGRSFYLNRFFGKEKINSKLGEQTPSLKILSSPEESRTGLHSLY